MYYTDIEIARLFREKIDEDWMFNLIKPHPVKRDIYIVDMVDLENPTKEQKTKVQQAVRESCAYNQRYTDPFSGERLEQNAQLHHALITRSMVVKNKNAHLIHCSYNCIMLNPDTHLDSGKAGNRAFGASILKELYGNQVEIWYTSFPSAIPFSSGIFE